MEFVADVYFYVHLGIILIIGITLHEFGHAAAALYFGDDTSARLGRVSLNPLKHLDPLGSLCFIIFKFGWGKPVPVDISQFKNPRRDHALVALAGPMMNLLQAFVFAAAYFHGALEDHQQIRQFLYLALVVNCSLAVFNLLPFPPLDGGAIVSYFIKNPITYAKFQRQAPPIFLAVMVIGIATGIPIFSTLTGPIVKGLLDLMHFILG